MDHAEDFQITGTISDYLRKRLEDGKQDLVYTREYFKADFLTAVANSLFTLRREAGLTQAQIAERLSTKQSAIARLEADFDGAMSLRRYIDFVLACGFVPHQLAFTSIEAARTFLIAQPAISLTLENQAKVSKLTFRLELKPDLILSQKPLSFTTSATTLQEAEPNLSGYEVSPAFDRNRITTIQATPVRSAIAGRLSPQERAA